MPTGDPTAAAAANAAYMRLACSRESANTRELEYWQQIAMRLIKSFATTLAKLAPLSLLRWQVLVKHTATKKKKKKLVNKRLKSFNSLIA